MAKGENIFRRRDGRWEARYIKGRELSGKIKYGYCYGKTYREAKEKAAKRKAALANGAPLPTARTQKPFSSYCLEWLHTKKCTVKESTYIKYSPAVNKHIIPKLGVCHPLGFTTELMDDFIKELQFEDELAPKTVHDILVVLHGDYQKLPPMEERKCKEHVAILDLENSYHSYLEKQETLDISVFTRSIR